MSTLKAIGFLPDDGKPLRVVQQGDALAFPMEDGSKLAYFNADKALVSGDAFQTFSASQGTNPFLASTPIVPRMKGDRAWNSTSEEWWDAIAIAAEEASWKISATSATGTWGSIGGVLSNQSDLVAALFEKADTADARFPTSNEKSLLAAIYALAGVGLLKLTDGVPTIDSSVYLTGNQTITISGDVSGSGATSITTTLASSGATAGSYGSASKSVALTVDSKGRITAISAGDISIGESQVVNLITHLAAKADASALASHTGDTSNPHSVTAAQSGALGIANNLSDLSNAGTARGNIGLGNSATKNVGSTTGTVAAGDDPRFTPGTAVANTALGRDASGGWVQRTSAQLKAWLSLAKGDVGLGNVDNTPDADKPVSTAQRTAIDSAAAQALADATDAAESMVAGEAEQRIAADGEIWNTLDAKADLVDGKVPASQLPSFVDDVIEAANFAALPAEGEAGKIYVTLDDGRTWRWGGTAYAEISASLALGETATTAYRGDRGKAAYDHTARADNPHNVTKAQVGLGSCDNTSDLEKPLSTAATAALALKAPLASPALTGIPTVPTATAGTNTTQAASTAFALANIPVVPWYFELSNTGNGAGVGTLTLTCTAPTTLAITGGGKFYTDSGGTTGEATSRSLAVGSNTIYVKVTSGKSSCKVAQGLFVSQINSWTASTNAPSLKFSLKNAPVGLTVLSVGGSNTLSGSLADLPSGVTTVGISGSNTISGSLADLPSGVTIVGISGSNTISGSLADLPSGVTYVSISGSNTISGSLADLPSGVTFVGIYGSNTVSGSLADLPSGVTIVGIYGSNTCTYNTTSGSRTWASGMRQVYCRSTTTTSLTSAMIDAILIDLSAQATWSNEKSVSLKGTRTSASDAAVSTLTGYGVVVTVTA